MPKGYPIYTLGIHMAAKEEWQAAAMAIQLGDALGRDISVGYKPADITGRAEHILQVGEWKTKATATRWAKKTLRATKKLGIPGAVMATMWRGPNKPGALWDPRTESWFSF